MMIGSERIRPTTAPMMSTVRLRRQLIGRSRGNWETPRIGIPLMVCRLNPVTRIWKYDGITLNCTISFSQVVASSSISCIDAVRSARMTMSML